MEAERDKRHWKMQNKQNKQGFFSTGAGSAESPAEAERPDFVLGIFYSAQTCGSSGFSLSSNSDSPSSGNLDSRRCMSKQDYRSGGGEQKLFMQDNRGSRQKVVILNGGWYSSWGFPPQLFRHSVVSESLRRHGQPARHL